MEPFDMQVVDDWVQPAGNAPFCSDYLLQDDNEPIPGESDLFKSQNQEQLVDSFMHDWLFDDLRFDMVLQQVRAKPESISSGLGWKESEVLEVPAPVEKNIHPSPLASLGLLNEFGNGLKPLKSETNSRPGTCELRNKAVVCPQLSTEEIMRLAGARFLQSSAAETPILLHNPCDISFSGLSEEEARNVQLAELLLASAEKVGEKQYERASRLLNQCDRLASRTGNPVQRVTHYFSRALLERIDRETGKIVPKDLDNGHQQQQDDAIVETMMVPDLVIPACHGSIPFYQVSHMVAVQAITENVAKAKRIHIIDLDIWNGIHLAVLMQALASRCGRPVEFLKVSAVGSGSAKKKLIEQTGKRLSAFAQTIKLPFSFKAVILPKLVDIKEELFEIYKDETLAVYSEYFFGTLIAQPIQVDSIMKVIKKMNPSIMVVIDVEANHNSPSFVSRFIETLFYKSAYFDCIDACMDPHDPSRMVLESFYLGETIRNLLAFDGVNSGTRTVKIDIWRTYFSRSGMVESELSASSLFQAELLLKKFDCWRSCTFIRNERSLLIGWKGTPMISLSTWKFLTTRVTKF